MFARSHQQGFKAQSGPIASLTQKTSPRQTAKPGEAAGTGPGFRFGHVSIWPVQGRIIAHGKALGEEEAVKGDGTGPAAGSPSRVSAPTPSPVPAAGPTPQALTISNVRGPTPNNCGSYEWVIQWVLAAKSKGGGHVVQHLVAEYNITDAAGKDITVAKMGKKKWDYWEAWPFNASQKVTTFAEGGDREDDTYTDKDFSTGTKGKIMVTGDASFYEGLTALPAGFKKNNPDTQAGILPSTTSDPKLTGGTPNVDHDLTVSWDCSTASSATVIVSHTP